MGTCGRAAIALNVAVFSFVLVLSIAAADPGVADSEPVDLANYKLKLPWLPDYYLSGRVAALSADAKTVWAPSRADGANLTLAQFDAVSGKRTREFPFAKGNLLKVHSVALAPNQKILAASVMMNNVPGAPREVSQVRVWNLVNGKELRTLGGISVGVGQLGFSSDGKILVACAHMFGNHDNTWEGILRVWDLAANKLLFSKDEFDGPLSATAIAPDGKTLYWLAGKTLHVTDLATGNETATAAMAARDMPDNIRISPDGATMVMVGQHLIEFWDVATLKPRKAVVVSPIGGGTPVFTSDSKTVAIPVYERVGFFDCQTGECLGVITAARPKYVPSSVSISGDGKIMLAMEDGATNEGPRLFDTSKLDPPPEFKSAADAQTLFPPHVPRGKPQSNSRADKIAKAAADKAAADKANSDKAAANGANKPTATVDLPDTTPATPAATPPTTNNVSPPVVVKPNASGPTKSNTTDATAFVGAWTANESPFRVTWTFSQNDGVWIIKAVYTRHGKAAGSAHGVDAKIVNGTLTFTRIFDKKPDHGFSDDSPVVLEPSGDHLNYTANTGAKTKHLRLDRFGK